MYTKRNKTLDIISLYSGNYKSEFYLRQISKISKISLKTCQNVLAELEDLRVLKTRVEGKNKYFSLNFDNIQTKSYLLQMEIYKTNLFIEKYPLFNSFLKEISSRQPIIIFGSFAKMEAKEDSDIDLLIVEDKETFLPFHVLPYKIHKITLKDNHFLQSLNEKEPLLEEIKMNHVILNNHSFYVDTMWSIYGK